MTGKRPFRFYMPDGTIETNTDTAYLRGKGMDDAYILRRQAQQEAHLVAERHHERNWRYREMAHTDKLMMPDSTYDGQPVKDSPMETDILAYRKALRDYDLKHMERPVRPGWFRPVQ
ncbi:hypothetical protein CI610_00320 [invertebrate metagenome]|uniref:Uncharacterized protein n=1 Tax=invertebrate metagenome TaxID=1711999 RepID=A0A2H9TBU4_9ZZZZ